MSQPAQMNLNTEIKIPNEETKKAVITTNSNQNNIINPAQISTEQLKPSVTISSNLRNSLISEDPSNLILKSDISFFKWNKKINEKLKNIYEGCKSLLSLNKNQIESGSDRRKFLNIIPKKYRPFQNIPDSKSHLLWNRRRRGKGSINSTLFLLKTAITASTVYGSYQLGVWGSTEDSSRAAKKVLDFFDFEQTKKDLNFQKIHFQLKEGYNQTLKYTTAKIEGFLPETAITFYHDSLRFVSNNIVKSE